MSQPYVGEVRLVGFTFAPVGWALCNGQLLPISQYETLYNLIGTTYGGDGVNTFALPDLRGRVPVHQGTLAGEALVLGTVAGSEQVTITQSTYPAHSHSITESTVKPSSTTANPQGGSVIGGLNLYTNAAPGTAMQSQMIGTATGGSQPHENRQPFLALNWIISLFGIFPSQS